MKSPVVRSLIAILAGIVVAVIVVAVVETVGMMLFPLPEGVDPTDSSQLTRAMEDIPAGAKVSVVVAWVLGAFAGSWVAAWMGRRWVMRSTMRLGIIVGLVVVLFVAINLLMITHPMWMAIAGLVLPLAAAWLGAVIVGKPGGDLPIGDE